MSDDVISRDEVTTMMWSLADLRTDVREIKEYLLGDEEEEDEEEDEG